MALDLLVPDLLPPAAAPAEMREVRLPALERWLARADLETVHVAGATAWLAAAFGLRSPAPVASIALAGEEAPREGEWLRADPVHLRVDRDAVALHGAAVLEVTREEAAALVATLAAHFRDDGLAFHAPAPDRWYVRVPEVEMPATTPLDEALGRNVFGLLPHGSGRINWAAAITEVQMIFAGHEVNQRREAAGKPAINSVWFWGGGPLPPSLGRPYAVIHADDAFARGLGRASGADVLPVPGTLDALDAVAEGESVLAVATGLTGPLHRGDAQAWRGAAERLDDEWFRELGGTVERFGRVRLVLPAERVTRVFTVTPAARWRWFRARRALASHA